MSSRSLAPLYLASWASIPLNAPPTINAALAASTPRLYTPDAVERKHHLLGDYSRQLQLGGWDGTGEFSVNADPPPEFSIDADDYRPLTGLTPEQFDDCTFDQVLADTNMDFELDKSEYMAFLYINSARYGYMLDSTDQDTFAELPLEFPMLFHSTACLCAYGEVGTQVLLNVDFGCCEGDNGHIVVYDSAGLFGEMTDEEYAYSSLFCAEAIHLYPEFLAAAPIVTTAPTIAPSTGSPTTLEPSVSATDEPTTIVPTTIAPTTDTPSTAIPTDTPSTVIPTASPSVEVTTLSPTEFVETDIPTAAVTTLSPTEGVIETDSPTAAEPFPTISPVAETPSPTPLVVFPTISPTVATAPPVVSVLETSSPTITIIFPTISPTAGTDTVSPTSSPVIAVSTSSPTIAFTSTDLTIEIQYDYNSECGVTAEDVMSGNDGITLTEGFILATEAIVVDILNSTYPRNDDSSPAPSPETTFVTGSTTSPIAGASSFPTPQVSSDESAGTASPIALLLPTLPPSGESAGTIVPTPSTSSEVSSGTSPPTIPGTATTSTTPTAAVSGETTEGGSSGTLPPTVAASGGASGGSSGGTLSPSGIATTASSTTSTIVASSETSEEGSVTTRSGSNSLTESYLRGATVHDKSAREDPSVKTSHNSPDIFHGLRTRVDEFPRQTDSNGLRRRGLVVLRSGLRSGRHRSNDLGQQLQRRSRLLVYYTQTNPVVISNIEDVLDSCPSGSTCMKVTSTITVTLEAGDDPDDVEEAIRSGFEESIQDAGIAEALPTDTVTCPDDGDSSPAPTPATTDVSGETSAPTPLSSDESAGTTVPTLLTTSASGESLAPTPLSSDDSAGTTVPTPSASSDVSGGTSPPTSPGAETASTFPTAAVSGETTEGGSSGTLPPTVAASLGASGGGSGGTLSPTVLATATTSTIPTAVASGGTPEGLSSSTLLPTVAASGAASDVGSSSETSEGSDGAPSPATLTRTPIASSRGGVIVPPTLRDTIVGGNTPTHTTMMDTGSIHSEKLSLDRRPT